MFQVAILLNNTDANFSLSFMSKDTADAAFDRISAAKVAKQPVTEKDDFGYIAVIDGADIAYALFIDISQAQVCQHEKNLAIARAGKDLAERVNKSPEEAILLGIGQNPQRSQILNS